MKKLLFVTPVFDTTNSDGLNLRVTNLAKILAKHYEVTLLSAAEPNILSQEFRFKRVHILPKIRSTPLRKIWLMLTGRSALEIYSAVATSRLVRELWSDTDIIYCCYVTMANIFADKEFRTKPLVVDFVDAISLHYAEAKTANLLKRFRFWVEASRVTHLERKILDVCILGFITSEVEKKALGGDSSLTSSNKVVVLSNGVEEVPIFESLSGVSNTVGFLGRMDYYPNIEASRRLVRRILPELAKRGIDLKCRIIGSTPTAEVLALQGDAVNVTGWVEHVGDELKKVDLVVLPMEVASGVQNKLLTSMSHGKLVITTRRVDTGSLPLTHGKNIIFAESDHEYCDWIARIFRDPSLIFTIGKAAHETIRSSAQWSSIESSLTTALSVRGLK